MPAILVPQMLFVGFFVAIDKIPVFLRWAQYLCSLKYAMNLALMVEFDSALPSCSDDDIAEQNCERLLEDNDVEPSRFYVDIIMLLVLFLGFRLLGSFILVEKARTFSA